MNYDTQTKFIFNLMKKNKKVRDLIRKFKVNMFKESYRQERLIIKGQIISDKVLRDLNV